MMRLDLREVLVIDGFGFAGQAEEGGFCLVFSGLEDELRGRVLGDPEVTFGESPCVREKLAVAGGDEAAHVRGQAGSSTAPPASS